MAVPRVEIADLMEATFWEANKVRIGSALGVIVVLVLAWRGWANHQEEANASNWSALFDDGLALNPDVDLSKIDADSAAAAWALLGKARAAFAKGDFTGAEAALKELRNSAKFNELDRSGAITKLADDVAAELAFKTTNTEPSNARFATNGPPLTWDSGGSQIEVSIFESAATGPVKGFVDALRNGSISNVIFDESVNETELVASPAWSSNGSALNVDSGLFTNQIRVSSTPSNRAGTVSIRFQPGYTLESAAPELAPKLVINLADRPDRDSDSMVIGTITRGLDALERGAKGERDDDGHLKTPIQVSRVASK